MSKQTKTAPAYLQDMKKLPAAERKRVWGDHPTSDAKDTWNYFEKERQKNSPKKKSREGQKRVKSIRPAHPKLLKYAQTSKRTEGERMMKDILDRYLPGCSEQVVIGWYIVDFLHEATRTVIEVDGEYHFFRQNEDALRTRYLEAQGLQVLRFTNHEVIEQPLDAIVRITAIKGAAFAVDQRA